MPYEHCVGLSLANRCEARKLGPPTVYRISYIEIPINPFGEKVPPYRLFRFFCLLLFTILLDISFAIKPYTVHYSLPLSSVFAGISRHNVRPCCYLLLFRKDLSRIEDIIGVKKFFDLLHRCDYLR